MMLGPLPLWIQTAILAQRDILDIVESVLDLPMAAD